MAVTRTMSGLERMLAACRREPVDATPVWFMRQAGRCFSEYRKLQKEHGFLTICKTPELSTKVALMPMERLNVDAAVMFADIILPLEGMGVQAYIEPEVGPIITNPVRSAADVNALRVIDPVESTPYVFETVRILRQELQNENAVIGFSAAPFLLACYMIEGRPSKDYSLAKGMMLGQPELWHTLMDKLTRMVVGYLSEQVAAGIQVAQLFDSWIGALSPQQYREYVLPYTTRIFDELGPLGIPTIHFGTGAAALIELMTSAGGDLIGVDWRIPLDQAWARIGYDRGIQGNLDPATMLAPFEVIQNEARDVLARAEGRAGHIFSLGHGVHPDTHPEDLARLVELVHEDTKRAA